MTIYSAHYQVRRAEMTWTPTDRQVGDFGGLDFATATTPIDHCGMKQAFPAINATEGFRCLEPGSR